MQMTLHQILKKNGVNFEVSWDQQLERLSLHEIKLLLI